MINHLNDIGHDNYRVGSDSRELDIIATGRSLASKVRQTAARIQHLINTNPWLMLLTVYVCTVLYLPLSPLSIYSHEIGHKIAGHLLWEDEASEIHLNNYGFHGGYMVHNGKKLSFIGEYFGEKGSRALLSAAGPAADAAKISLAFFSQSLLAVVIGLFESGQLACYSASYYTTDCSENHGHDFCSLGNKAGPAAVIGFIAFSILSMSLFFYRLGRIFHRTIHNPK